ncbi:hypothetical protein JX266_010469 [Neoarthrinium moseri]|nr:hypothetical protein JX266_010469 [Neoarthrinium moseri]
MGRKHAPEPLSLASPHSRPHVGSGPVSSNGSGPVSPAAVTSPTQKSSVPASQGHRSPHVAEASIETSLQVIPTPTSSKSPRSPRSPFSKFNTTSKKGDPRQVQTSHAQSPSHLQSKFAAQQSPEYPHFDYKAGPLEESYDQQFYHYPSGEAQHQGTQDQHNPTSTSSRPPVEPPPATAPTTRAAREGAGSHQHSAQQPGSGREEEKHSRSASRFFNFKSSKGAQHQREHTRDYHRKRDPSQHSNSSNATGSGEAMSRGQDPQIASDRGSTKTSKHSDHSNELQSAQPNTMAQPSRSDVSLASGDYDSSTLKRGKPKPFTLLNRTRSMKERESPSPKETNPEVRIQEPERAHVYTGQQPLKTAPIDKDGQVNDRSFRHMMDSSTRNHSADRAVHRDRPNKETRPDKDHTQSQNRSHPSSFKDSSGSTFFGNLKSSGSRAADMFSSRIFGNKSGRSGSTTEREHVVDDEHYQLKVLNLPLIEQVRKTRISKKLEEARDKTEFWMPAFPWRAIDYLNYKGSDVEGLYRVPGSGPQVKKWQRKFDEEYDVDLFAQEDLYDINIIGSMLKAWLRELPDELFPKAAQERIARECKDSETVPQLLIEELSNLPPYNYYLLFAITCHLSLLLAHSAKNRMDYRNLCICFQPCLKIDAFCFKFLVCEWRDCWKGCRSESQFIEEEYALLHQTPPSTLAAGVVEPPPEPQASNGGRHGNGDGNGNGNGNAPLGRSRTEPHIDDRYLSSSDSSQHAATQGTAQSYDQQQNGKLRKKSTAQNGSVNSIPAGLTVAGQETSGRAGELRPLSPIKPLSPLGF